MYDGTQLRSHWIYETADVAGDALVAFRGPAAVPLEHMVDLEDVKARDAIASADMVHFIGEWFDTDLEKAVLRQRLLMAVMQAVLTRLAPRLAVSREGDDLMAEVSGSPIPRRKMTVSIATASPVSTLIHAAINVDSRATPVPTLGLDDVEVDPEIFARKVLEAFAEEMEGVFTARCKVRPVA